MIPLVEDTTSFDVVPRLYRRALLNTLIELRPKHCLEIGTFYGESAQVFSHYFTKYMPEGKLITADISDWQRPPLDIPNVFPVMVYPHHLAVEAQHGGINIYHSDWHSRIIDGKKSVAINGAIINRKMEDENIDEFQFCFIDGDHSLKGFLSDLHICLPLINPDGHILIDDINDNNHPELVEYYHKTFKHQNKCYEFNDHDPNPGMALVKVEGIKT